MLGDDTALTLKVRPFWEAADAGILLARQWWAPVVVFYVLPVSLIGVSLSLLLGNEPWWLIMALLWWLRPLTDRLVLGWAGARFFQTLDWGEMFKRTLRSFDAALLADLTWRRFSPASSFLAPVSFLEGGTNDQRRRRRKWLAADHLGMLTLLAFAMLAVELSVGLSLWATGSELFSPALWGADNGRKVTFQGFEAGLLSTAAQLLAQPIYLLSCFSLYVGTRTRKEGWDLSLAFRSLRAKAAQHKPLAVLVLLGTLLVPRAEAEAFTPPSTPSAQAGEWQRVVADPDFAHEVPSWKIKWKGDKGTPDQASAPLQGAPWSAELLRGGMVALGAVAVIVLLTAVVLNLRRKAKPAAASPQPEAPWQADVLDLWVQGHPREALSALYRAALVQAGERFGLKAPGSATEGDCLRLLAQVPDPAFAQASARLVSLWSALAWGGRLPSEESFRAAVASLSRGRAS